MKFVPAVAVVCFLAWSLIYLKSDFSWDDADPEILYQALRMMNGQSIYRDIGTPPFSFAIYPPLYFAATAALLPFTGLSFLPARLISFVSALFIVWAIVSLNRQWNKSRWGGLWAASLLFLVPAFLYNSARCHVQMMAVAFSIWSFVFFLRNRWQYTLVLSPILAVLALYTKQSQIALPLAMALYLAFRNRRRLLPYLSVLLAAGLIPFIWLQKATGGYFFLDTVQLARLTYDPLYIPQIFMHHAGPLILFLGMCLTAAWRRLKNREWEAPDFYLASVFAVTLLSLGRPGAHGQYVVELLVVTMVYLLYTRIPEMRGRAALVTAQILILFVYAPLFIFLEEGLHNMAANRAAARVYPVIRKAAGPILSQQGSFPLFSRGEIYVQLFHFTGLYRAGLWDQGQLLKDVERNKFSYVITEFPVEEPVISADVKERFTPEMIDALRKKYRRFEFFSPYYLYRPK